jgi:hypothetical protein
MSFAVELVCELWSGWVRSIIHDASLRLERSWEHDVAEAGCFIWTCEAGCSFNGGEGILSQTLAHTE